MKNFYIGIIAMVLFSCQPQDVEKVKLEKKQVISELKGSTSMSQSTTDCKVLPFKNVTYIDVANDNLCILQDLNGKSGVARVLNIETGSLDKLIGVNNLKSFLTPNDITYNLKRGDVKLPSSLYRLDKGKQTKIKGNHTIIDFVINSKNELYALLDINNIIKLAKYENDKWKVIQALVGVKKLFVSKRDELYVIRSTKNKSGIISRISNAKLENVPGSGIAYMDWDKNNNILGTMVGRSGVFRYLTEAKKWERIYDQECIQFSVGREYIYFLKENGEIKKCQLK